MAVSIVWTTTFRNRVRLLAGIEQEELDNATMDMLSNIAAEWFNENTGLTFAIGDLQVYYDTSDYDVWETLAQQSLLMKLGLSIKRTTYNANPWIGDVNWKKNVTGVDATKNMYPRVRGVQYNA